jgi:hypothetical protein
MPEYARNKHGVIFVYPDVHDVEANMSHHHRLKSESRSRLGSSIDQDPVPAITEESVSLTAQGFAWRNRLTKDCERPAWGPHFF